MVLLAQLVEKASEIIVTDSKDGQQLTVNMEVKQDDLKTYEDWLTSASFVNPYNLV